MLHNPLYVTFSISPVFNLPSGQRAKIKRGGGDLPVIQYFFCLPTLLDSMMLLLNVLYKFAL